MHDFGKVSARLLSLNRVKKHRHLAYVTQLAVYPFRCVTPSQRVSSQRNLEQGEPLGIAFLPDIRLEIAAVKLFYVRLYGYVIQKPAAFRHKL
jgi:hypothetical protein